RMQERALRFPAGRLLASATFQEGRAWQAATRPPRQITSRRDIWPRKGFTHYLPRFKHCSQRFILGRAAYISRDLAAQVCAPIGNFGRISWSAANHPCSEQQRSWLCANG